jgi:tRNA dimethylallyltransferase
VNIDPALPAMRAIGVRPLVSAARGETSLEAAAVAAKMETRQYVKRQETWLRRNMSSWRPVDTKYMESYMREIFSFI